MAGRHITIDATVSDPSVFSHTHLRRFFVGLCKLLDMQIIFGPVFKDVTLNPKKLAAVRAGGTFEDEGGTTGFAVISTSHMSIHSYELRKFCQLDVFSCKDFDSEKAYAYIKETLGVTKASISEIVRYDQDTPPLVIKTECG